MMGKEKMPNYWLPWLVGMPAETSLAICSMIFGGIFERFPNLKVAFAHGGGTYDLISSRLEISSLILCTGSRYNSFIFCTIRTLIIPILGAFPITVGRIEHGWWVRPDLCAITNKENPRKYLGKFWVDSLVHDEGALKFIVELFGADKVFLGSDYPFPRM
jgi:aminocarboxymuconate-semialdehyde decarboxylase